MKMSRRFFLTVSLAMLALLTAKGSEGSEDPLSTYSHKMSSALKNQIAVDALGTSPVNVILAVDPSYYQPISDSKGYGKIKNLDLIKSYGCTLTTGQIKQLLAAQVVTYVTLDLPIARASTENKSDRETIGAIAANGLGYNGDRVAVAVFDSGIYPHADAGRIAVSMDFASGVPVRNSHSDENGHGSHVAGIIAGNGKSSAGMISGVSPLVDLIDIRVLDREGVGFTSNLILAMDWVIGNKGKYKIRAANLSLGHLPIESWIYDPLCQAAEKLVASGIVTVVSGGNIGKTTINPSVWGGITSPANAPSVITVAPLNTRGSVSQADDIATTYGSRGPTYLDNLYKPDLSAPGNGIASWAVPGSHLLSTHPELGINSKYMQLSGSSMAAPFVTGTVALMLDANSRLSPAQIKMILLLTAIKLDGPHMLEQGNGLVNTYKAVQLAAAIDKSDGHVTKVVNPKWLLQGAEVWTGGAFAIHKRVFYSGLVDLQKVTTWGSGVRWKDGLKWVEGTPWTSGFFGSTELPVSTSLDPWMETALGGGGIFWTDNVNWKGTANGGGIFWCDVALGMTPVTLSTILPDNSAGDSR